MKTGYELAIVTFVFSIVCFWMSIGINKYLSDAQKFAYLGVLSLVVSALIICVAIWEDLPTEEEVKQ